MHAVISNFYSLYAKHAHYPCAKSPLFHWQGVKKGRGLKVQEEKLKDKVSCPVLFEFISYTHESCKYNK